MVDSVIFWWALLSTDKLGLSEQSLSFEWIFEAVGSGDILVTELGGKYLSLRRFLIGFEGDFWFILKHLNKEIKSVAFYFVTKKLIFTLEQKPEYIWKTSTFGS